MAIHSCIVLVLLGSIVCGDSIVIGRLLDFLVRRLSGTISNDARIESNRGRATELLEGACAKCGERILPARFYGRRLSEAQEDIDAKLEAWKMRRLINSLAVYRAVDKAGIGLVTYLITGKEKLHDARSCLEDWMTKTGLKGKNKGNPSEESLLEAIREILSKLNKYESTPMNGIAFYSGMCKDENGKESRICVDIVPCSPIKSNMFRYGPTFLTNAIEDSYESKTKMGLIIVDGKGALFGTMSGASREVIHTFSVDLPKKHSMGGQSAARFGRIRLEKRQAFVRMVGELATQFFIKDDNPTVAGLIIGGVGDLKNDLVKDDFFDERLEKIIIKPVLTLPYGGMNGFNTAVDRTRDTLARFRLASQDRTISRLFDEMAKDTRKYCFGAKETLSSLEGCMIETLLIWDELELRRIQLRNSNTNGEQVIYVTPQEATEDSVKGDLVSNELLVDWVVSNYKQFGCSLELVSDGSPEGFQFCKGLGGIGGILRYERSEPDGKFDGPGGELEDDDASSWASE